MRDAKKKLIGISQAQKISKTKLQLKRTLKDYKNNFSLLKLTAMAAKKNKSTQSKNKSEDRIILTNIKPKLPDIIYAQASPHSIGGVSLFDASYQINSETVGNFFSEDALIYQAADMLKKAGFDVLSVSRTSINIAGDRATYETAFKTKITAEERETLKSGPQKTHATFLECPDTEMPGLISVKDTPFEQVLEGVAIEQPRYFMAPSAFAPHKSYWHLRIPGDIAEAANATAAHVNGITGAGITVAMVDTGWYAHPYFAAQGYNVAPVTLGPAAVDAASDDVGHGTGESANIFAIAPSARLLPVKMNFVNTIGAFNAAVALNPTIITCSWGSSLRNGPLSAADSALAAAIAAAVATGIIVIFSAGNGHWGFPGQHPDVISAGGVYMDQNGMLQASNYASGFNSNIYSGRRVPDLSGLVGMMPRAIYIMLPLQAGCEIDMGNAGGSFPNGDETPNNDGWAAFSGTSAAAPQLAGTAALIKQACPKLTPAQVKSIMMNTAIDVTTGTCNTSTGGNPATIGPDTATGNGLVNAYKAVLSAKLNCLTIRPITPITIRPIEPIQPISPIRPISPILPITPIRPISPISPIRPINPIIPPIKPIDPIGPVTTLERSAGEQNAAWYEVSDKQESNSSASPNLTEGDLKGIQEMIDKGEIGFKDLP
ncbi:MAG TPA: S8 family serine peptidase [Chitinophagales bacterium]|nr:S8 family serine peptidase [Chitinophagales bacterium]